MAKSVKRNVRFDSRHVRLKVGETEKAAGGYEYRWTGKDGKRHSIYAATLESCSCHACGCRKHWPKPRSYCC